MKQRDRSTGKHHRRHRHRNRRQEADYDEINADDDRTSIEVGEVIDLLGRIERHREALECEQATLTRWLAGAPELAADWAGFTRMGGVTAEDFARYLDGRLRSRRTRRKRHLRLVVVNNKAGSDQHVRYDGHDDAA